ncbi:hypothetical protein [Hoeflea sp.]|uniref:hypothetical protein n=1 Tax=Hoeflea sp. TaxID=1940281 RepID=UPI003A8FDB15
MGARHDRREQKKRQKKDNPLLIEQAKHLAEIHDQTSSLTSSDDTAINHPENRQIDADHPLQIRRRTSPVQAPKQHPKPFKTLGTQPD